MWISTVLLVVCACARLVDGNQGFLIGTTKFRNFVMDYRELPKIGLYGTFATRMFITYDKKRMACVHVLVNFEIRNADASDEVDVVDTILSPGPGRWLVLNIHTCANPEQYDIMLEITSKKINRTHDCFGINMKLESELNVTYGVEVELYQEADGGFKYHQTIKDDSICTWILTNARENAERALALAKIDPPKCPIPAGFIHGENFVMDYRELPRIGLYGTWEARVFITYHKKRVACVSLILNFEIRNDDESNEDDVIGSFLSPVKSMMTGF